MANNTKHKPGNSTSTTSIKRDFAGLVFLFLSLFTLLALFSHHSMDPSFFTSTTQPARNLAGKIGSHWSAFLLQSVGAAAFLVGTLFLLAGVALFRRISRVEWALAILNYVFLLLSATALLGIAGSPLTLGGSRFEMGGLLGSFTGGFLHNQLNTAGAVLLTLCLTVFAVSLSTRVSVRNLGLWAWLGLSKASVFLAGVSVYAAMRFSTGMSAVIRALAPRLGAAVRAFRARLAKSFAHIQAKRAEAAAARATAQAEESKVPVVTIPEPILEDTAPLAPVIPLRGSQEPVTFEAAPITEVPVDSTEPSIVTSGTAHLTEEILANQAGEEKPAAKGSSLMNMVRKAVRSNERAVKTALGKNQNWQLPPTNLLRATVHTEIQVNREEVNANARLLQEKLKVFKVEGDVKEVKVGPVVTMYEFKPSAGVKVNTIANLADDLALALSAESVRIVAPIPGRDVVGIEVPNKNRQAVGLKEIIGADLFRLPKYQIPIAIGKDILGAPFVADLRSMPHLLVAGATGSGKSVFVNALVVSLLYRFTPDELKLILVDPKQLELAPYSDIPHLLLPVVTDPKKASLAIRWAVEEMERRYRMIAKTGMRDADGYNEKLRKIGPEAMRELLSKGEEIPVEEAESMPKLVIIIDELADLMMTARQDVENNICRLAQKARAAGIHLVLATQRPSVDVVTGLIKANLPTRISFRLTSKNDSRTIFDTMGAERLVGKGDMLFMPPGDSRLLRLHGAYVGEDEVEGIAGFWREQGRPEFREEILVDPEEEMAALEGADGEMLDSRFGEALDVAFALGAVSTSLLQRKLALGYTRAARIMDMMEAKGIVGPGQGSKPRPVIGPRPQI